ncbi:MAG: amidohydrolase family protein [Bacteroidales bacterium]|nr:amidohydrolase family protein [Bacteroidales bacterium]
MYYNSHIHTFKDTDVPRKFLPLGLVRLLATKPGFYLTAKILNNLNPFSDKDVFDRYIKFARIGKLGSQQEIFENCKEHYPEDTNFVILPMDMAFMGAGKVPRPYKNQLEELANLKKLYPQIIPFIHVDPRRKEILNLLKKSVEEWDFKGVKLYPPLGYFPYDEDLYPIYDYCQENNIPIIAHCSPYNPVHYKGSKKDLLKLLSKSKTHISIKGKKKKELCSHFTHPENYEYVLKDFDKLKICLAHFGSEYYWDKYLDSPSDITNWFVIIKNMIEKHKNLYTDLSFTLNNKEYFSLLKVLLSNNKIKHKILFGSDYYMVQTKTYERRFGIDLRAFIGEVNFKIIAHDNPIAFLS